MMAALNGIASIESVLRLAKHVPVFPCRPREEQGFKNGRPTVYRAKSPYPENGFLDATQDEAQIKAWWKEYPDALVGVPTGQTTRLIAIDWDPDKHADTTGAWLQEKAELLLSARVHGTNRGGRHYLFRIPAGQRYKTGTDLALGGTKRPGIDLRAEGGYIIWWPLHGGQVTNEHAPLLPAGLIDERLERDEPPQPLPQYTPVKWKRDKQLVADALAYLDPDCERDQWRDIGMAIHLATQGSEDGFNLWHAWSAGQITGTMPAKYSGIDDCRYTWDSFKDQASRLVTLGTVFHLAQGAGYTLPKREEPPRATESSHDPYAKYEAAHAAFERSEPKRTSEPAADLSSIELPKAASLPAIMATEPEYREWFFEEILPAGAFLIVGRPKVGKSWLLMQLAICAASCGDFLGFAALGKVGVLYITPEDDRTRIKLRFQRFNIDPPESMQVIEREDFNKLAAQFSDRLTLGQFVDLYLTQNPSIKFVFLDTESTCRNVWEGENGGSREKAITKKDYAEVREFDSIALKHRAFIGLVNHTAKRRNGTWFDIHELINRTNTALAGASGSIVLADPPGHDPMDTDSRVRVLGIRGRDINGDHLLAIEQQKDGTFTALGNWSEYAVTEVQEQICTAILEINEESPGQWITSKEVAKWLSKSAGTVQRAITRMVKSGRTQFKGHRFETKKKLGIKVHKIDEE